MTLFASEKEMQDWLSSVLVDPEGLAELLSNVDAINDTKPTNLAEARVLEAIQVCLGSLYIAEKIFENENISIGSDEILKPDFVLYAPETESIVILELKNIAGPTRQAGTELAAYSCEIRSAVPFLCDGDIVHVLISTEWPTLLKHYVRHEIFWHRRNIICLQPVEEEGEKQLRILPPDEIAEDVSSFKIGEQYLGGYQICLYDMGLYTEQRDRTRLDKYLEQFRSALLAMATVGNRMNSHGFAFLWRDNWGGSLAPYSITVLNFAPFQSLERFLHINDELPKPVRRMMELVRENSPQGHGNSLSEITDACMQMVDNICNPMVEAFTDWSILKDIMNDRADYVAFIGWGRFGEEYVENLKREYKNGNFSYSAMEPKIGLQVVCDLVDAAYHFVDLTYIRFADEEQMGEED